MSPTRLPAAQRRRQLLDVALQVFAERGYHQTSMNDLAETAGISKPVLYQHFDSKESLYRQLLSDVSEQLVTRITQAQQGADSARAGVASSFTAYFSFVAQERRTFSLLFGSGAPRESELAKSARAAEDEIADAIASMLDPHIPVATRRLIANSISGLAEGAVRSWLHEDAGLSAAELGDMVTAILFDGVAARNRSSN